MLPFKRLDALLESRELFALCGGEIGREGPVEAAACKHWSVWALSGRVRPGLTSVCRTERRDASESRQSQFLG